MNHATYRQWLVLHALEELPAEESAALYDHLNSCPSCRSELGQLRTMHRVVSEHRPVPINEPLLEEARRQRRIAIHELAGRQSALSAAIDTIRDFLSPPVRLAVAGACVLVLGILLGRFTFRMDDGALRQTPLFRTAALSTEEATGEPAVRNLQILERDEQGGTVEISFEAVSQVRMRGNINDDVIQSILARSLLAEKNPGRRLRTVNVLAAQSEEGSPVNAEVRSALISALENDPNPAVRKEALESLLPYLPDGEITRAFVHVLSRDQNTGLRIAAIKALDAANYAGQAAYPQVRRALEDAAKSDANKFIRIRAQQAIQETSP